MDKPVRWVPKAEAYRKETAAHGRMRKVARTLGLAAAALFALLVISVLAAWRLLMQELTTQS